DGEHRVADGDDGASLASAADQPAVAVAEEGVGTGHGGDGLADGGGQPRVSFAGAGALVPAGGLLVDGGEFGPGHQVRGGREGVHGHADLGDDLLDGTDADAGDLIQLLQRPDERGNKLLDPGVKSGDVGRGGVGAG